jgi:hypothetical protein
MRFLPRRSGGDPRVFEGRGGRDLTRDQQLATRDFFSVHPAVAWPMTGAFRVADSDQALLRHPGRIA